VGGAGLDADGAELGVASAGIVVLGEATDKLPAAESISLGFSLLTLVGGAISIGS